ncbi:DUF4974 domain-containing protein [Chitinophaga polysaccharea]|uniref:FecR family protein n=1 Tax=Chitinophaga polysaccharea TaxID=1293035 RepID=UPI0014559166|nr:FecR domain-containing protein [Chitinophaga polysaccharea]NLR58452.1 DUF4974 domain-containing protein [Chitinophaga polysaccharea]
MSTSEFKNIVERYLKGEASAVDQAMIEAWLAATEDSPVDLTADELSEIGVDMLQHLRVQNGYALGTEAGESASDAAYPEIKERRLLSWLQRIAAVLMVAISVGALFYWGRMFTRTRPPVVSVSTPAPVTIYRVRVVATDAVRRVMLPDSSIVLLNRASSLYYTIPFDHAIREIYMERGEAFFQVKQLAAHPFIVHAAKTRTTVLGTSFNIRISDNVRSIKVIVKTGKVQVATGLSIADSTRLLTPEQGIEINAAHNSVRAFSQPADIITSWYDGVLVFHQNTMKEVVEALENRYHVRIRLGTPATQQCRVSGNFTRSHTITEVLDAICLVHRLSYKKKNNEFFIY